MLRSRRFSFQAAARRAWCWKAARRSGRSLVVSGADPRRTFLQLVGEKHLPDEFVESIRRFRFRGASAKVNLALGELPDFTCLPGRGAHLRGAISISPSVEYLERAYDEAKYGEVSRRPYMDIVIPSMLDPAMAPPGKHVMSIFVQYAPYHVNGGWTDARREALGDTVVDTLAQYAPNLKGAILHRQVVTPADIERIVGLTEGNIFQGELSLQQMFFLRPAPAWAKYRTPLAGLYQCGAGTHPGGGVMGASGRNAARAILGARMNRADRHRRRRRRAGRGAAARARRPRGDDGRRRRSPRWTKAGSRRRCCASCACEGLELRLAGSVARGAAARRRPARALARHGALGRVDPPRERARRRALARVLQAHGAARALPGGALRRAAARSAERGLRAARAPPGRQGLEDLLRILPMPVAELLDDWFETDALKGALGAAGVLHLLQGPRSAGTAFRLLHHHVGCPPGRVPPAALERPRAAAQAAAGRAAADRGAAHRGARRRGHRRGAEGWPRARRVAWW